ncbi:hypothetical protein NVSP9465_03559 [Novosphingobium sp. CECT 9465]|nr:hypothetical protein NVSP9465_03559 [Novosphingobium sp. CECT 9465]
MGRVELIPKSPAWVASSSRISVSVSGFELVDEADPRVELGIERARRFSKPGIPIRTAEAVAIGHVAEMFERLYGQAVGLVDDDEGAGDAGGVMGDFVLRAARDRQPGIAQLNEVEAHTASIVLGVLLTDTV